MLLYSFWSTASPSKSSSSAVNVLVLMDERALGSLLDLQSEEELQLTHHAHLKLPGHLLRKLGDKSVRRATKDNIIHIYLN